MALILVISGVILYQLLWSDHDVVPNPDGAGEWRSAPWWIKRIVVRGDVPVLIGALFMQFAAAVMLALGLLSLTGLLVYSRVSFNAIASSWLLVGASWCAVELRARWWRRRSSQSRDHAKQKDREGA